jgi:D-alanine-D-alanine ligase
VRLALACNRSSLYQTGADRPDDEFEEFDSPETVEAIAQTIASFGHEVVSIEADATFPLVLAQGKFEFVFNISEGLHGRGREAQVPAVCEMMNIPFTGSDSVTMGITLDKDLARRVVAGQVPLACGKVFRRPEDIDFSGLSFPLFVKPNAEGSSKGIRNASRLNDPNTAREVITRLLQDYKGAVLAEEFLEGVECTVGVLGNSNPRIIGIMEIAPRHVPTDQFVYSLETKRDYLNQVEYRIPPRLPAADIKAIEQTVLRAYAALECRDFARIDIRFNGRREPCFIEANPLPGLSPVKGDLVILSRAMGLEYRDLIGEILTQAFGRNGLPT